MRLGWARHRPRTPPAGPAASDYASYMVTPKYVRRLREELVDVAHPFLADLLVDVQRPRIAALVDEFFETYPTRPVGENVGGSRFHNCFWLHLVLRSLDPALIVESGVWKGQTSWLFREACPAATIHSFDVTFRNLVHRDPSITYHEHDWGGFHFDAVDPARSLCFFDDHIDQAKRVREAHAKGFRTLLFDDNSPVHRIYSFGYPAAPTIDMLFDQNLEPGEVIEWTWKGEPRRWVYDAEEARAARALIARYEVFPDVSALTNYHGMHTFLSFVRLVDG
jgi:hypothetical protein